MSKTAVGLFVPIPTLPVSSMVRYSVTALPSDEPKKWKLLLNKVKLHAHKKHNFNNRLMKNIKINYIRINIYPDGGISRIRVLGRAE